MTDSPPTATGNMDLPPPPLTWQPRDTTLLAPQHLARTRPLRAWERKPASPFSKPSSSRPAKVWKRAAKPLASALPSTLTGDESKRRRLRQGARASSPVKIVKRLCLGASEGVGMLWEGVGSPRKRIVTRSSRGSGEGLVELGSGDVVDGDAEEEEEDVEGTVVEIVNEDGTVERGEVEGGEGWEDEGEEEEWDGTMMHLGDAVEHAGPEVVGALVFGQGDDPDATPLQEDEPTAIPDTTTQEANEPPIGEDAAVQILIAQEEPVCETFIQPNLAAPLQSSSGPFPAGFVSPVKRHRSVSKRLSMGVGRRRTLPRTFAPEVAAPSVATVEEEVAEPTRLEAEQEDDEQAASAEHGQDAVAMGDVQEPNMPEMDLGEAEEPIETLELPEKQPESTAELVAEEEDAGEDVSDEVPEIVVPETIEQSTEPTDEIMTSSEDPLEQSSESPIHDINETIPVTIDGPLPSRETPPLSPASIHQPQHPSPSPQHHHQDLPLRRSPRRKSSSPVKQRNPSTSRSDSHLVAFTPIKRSFTAPQVSPSPTSPAFSTLQTAQQDGGAEPATLRRSVSAPPEEPAATPRAKISKPRVSDDTALLQAFINRANDRKMKGFNNTDVPDEFAPSVATAIARRESLENRRDSNTVRLALASPGAKTTSIGVGEAGVLGDLDPNSPSPRKVVLPDLDLGGQVEEAPSEDSVADGKRRTRTSARRSVRSATPHKISLRGNANLEPVVLRGSEAQELARATKSNTRKNKGGSVMPVLRLTRLAGEKNGAVEEVRVEGGEEVVQGGENRKRKRGIVWDEQLVYYQDAPAPAAGVGSSSFSSIEDVEVVMEEAPGSPTQEPTVTEGLPLLSTNLPLPAPPSALKATRPARATMAPPPPAETPSKPKSKVRKLKTPRTAASALAVAPAVATTTVSEGDANGGAEEQPSQLPKPNPRVLKRSRIATPAKPASTNSASGGAATANAGAGAGVSVGPGAVPGAGVTGERTKLAPKRRVLSRLPAPFSASSTSSSSSLGSSGSQPTDLVGGGLVQPQPHAAPVPAPTAGMPMGAGSTLTSSPAKKKPSALLPAVKNFAPNKLDFSASLSRSSRAAAPSLMSPAKKMGGKSFASLPPPGEVEGEERSRTGGAGLGLGMGLGSPAKKRGRRG